MTVFVLPMIGALLAGVVLVLTVTGANGAPQEAAGAAIAIGLAVIPYVFARSVEKLTHVETGAEREERMHRIADKRAWNWSRRPSTWKERAALLFVLIAGLAAAILWTLPRK